MTILQTPEIQYILQASGNIATPTLNIMIYEKTKDAACKKASDIVKALCGNYHRFWLFNYVYEEVCQFSVNQPEPVVTIK